MKNEPVLACLALAVVMCCSSGCYGIPHYADPERDSQRQNVEQELWNFPKPGHHSRADVLLRLGEPDEPFSGDEAMVYHWTRIVLVWGAVGYCRNSSGTVKSRYTLFVEFNSAGIVTRCERKHVATWQEGDRCLFYP
jgi:hypothetical protein